MQEMWVWFLGQEDPLAKEMATHSSILARRIPCTEEPGGLQSMGSHRVNWVTNTFHFHLHMKTRQDIERVGFGFFSERRRASLFQGWIKGFQTCQCPWTHPQITKQAGWDGSIFRLSISFKHKKLILAIRCQSTAKCICVQNTISVNISGWVDLSICRSYSLRCRSAKIARGAQ